MAGLFIKLDTNYWNHPKIVAVGYLAGVLYQQMSMYCMDHTTDGHVPDAVLPRFGMPRVRQQVEALAGVGLIERDGEGWLVPGYVERYKTAAEVDELREKRRAAGRQGGRPRKQTEKPNGKQSAFTASNPEYIDTEIEIEGLASSDTSAARPLTSAPADPAESILGTLGIVGATPTPGEHALVARCLARGWTVGQLQAKAERALDADRPRQWLVKALEGCANEDPPAAPTSIGTATAAIGEGWSQQWTLLVTHQSAKANDVARQAWHDTRLIRRDQTETTAKFAFRDAYLARSAAPAGATA